MLDFQGLRSTVSDLANTIKLITNKNIPIPVEEKRQLIDELYREANEVAKIGLEAIESLETDPGVRAANTLFEDKQ